MIVEALVGAPKQNLSIPHVWPFKRTEHLFGGYLHQPYAEAATWQEQLCSRCFYFNALAPALALEISGRWVDMSADQWGETSEP